jgi:hypothetical protein
VAPQEQRSEGLAAAGGGDGTDERKGKQRYNRKRQNQDNHDDLRF